VDPVVAAAACVTALQTLASREADPATEGVVVSVTRLSTPRESTALNVMPDEVELGGTIRAFTVEAFERMQRRVYEVIRAQAQLHNCNATVDADGRIPYPPVVNEATLVDVGLRLAAQLNGAADAVQTQAAPIMVSHFIYQQPTELASWPADEQRLALTAPHSIDSACAPIPYPYPRHRSLMRSRARLRVATAAASGGSPPSTAAVTACSHVVARLQPQGAEDFAFYAQQAPSAFFFVRGHPPSRTLPCMHRACTLHHSA
jgi:metal-dependent amidase/aminoacylase/carboxypeptidase family protein